MTVRYAYLFISMELAQGNSEELEVFRHDKLLM